MATTTNYGWTTPDDTALVKDGAAAIRTLGSSVDTTTKALNPSTTLGDIEYRSSTANTNTRLGIGTTGQVLSVSGGVPAWTTPAGGGKVLQVLQDTHTGMVTTSSTSLQATNLSQAITPASASNKVLITANINGINKPSGNLDTAVKLVIDRDGTTIYSTSDFFAWEMTNKQLIVANTLVFLDSPATTSSRTYSIKFASTISGQTVAINAYNSSNTCDSSIVLMEIGA